MPPSWKSRGPNNRIHGLLRPWMLASRAGGVRNLRFPRHNHVHSFASQLEFERGPLPQRHRLPMVRIGGSGCGLAKGTRVKRYGEEVFHAACLGGGGGARATRQPFRRPTLYSHPPPRNAHAPLVSARPAAFRPPGAARALLSLATHRRPPIASYRDSAGAATPPALRSITAALAAGTSAQRTARRSSSARRRARPEPPPPTRGSAGSGSRRPRRQPRRRRRRRRQAGCRRRSRCGSTSSPRSARP